MTRLQTVAPHLSCGRVRQVHGLLRLAWVDHVGPKRPQAVSTRVVPGCVSDDLSAEDVSYGLKSLTMLSLLSSLLLTFSSRYPTSGIFLSRHKVIMRTRS